MKKYLSIFLATAVLLSLGANVVLAAPSQYYGIPTFNIKAVVEDDTVTIVTYNFPANVTFTVRMGAFGTLGIGGIVIDTQDSGSGGSFTATYDIPSALAGSYQIAIRLESSSTGYYAYNWFYNNTSGGTTTPPPSTYNGYPTFSISAVVRDQKVTIHGNNFPANDTFNVRIGAYGTLGIGGTVVTTQSTGSGGSFTATYNIPSSLAGSSKIAIRLESPTSAYYAYNWFYNNTTP